MSPVRTFDHTMIQAFLKSSGLKYLTDSDGDYVVEFSYNPDLDCELSYWFIVGGKDRDIYRVAVHTNKRLAQQQIGQAIVLCNEWNRERRWPKAYVNLVDSSGVSYGEIILEEQLNLEAGIHQELLNTFTLTVMVTGESFWKWANEQGI
jgi:hypothetical protein